MTADSLRSCYDPAVMGGIEGQLLVGKYRVERVLGQGGMGIVVAAHHTSLDEQVAIKFLLPGSLNDSSAIARFEREARAAVKIKSEHVARVTDVGRLENGAPYMVMELLRGLDLGALLRSEGPLPLPQVADYALQAGEAIAEAHGLGIVHRDLKPPNLFLTQRADGSSCVKVLDFGISKLTSGQANEQALTQTSAIMGSPLYMAPEQLMSSRDVDARADIWSLGVICFELLTGTLPFSGETLPQLCMAITSAPPRRLRELRPELPIELERLLLDCLEKDRERRVASVADFAGRIARFAPPEARLSADRIARLGAAPGPSLPALRSGVAQSGDRLEPAAVRGAHALTPSPQTLAEFGRTEAEFGSGKLRVGLFVGAFLLVGAAFATWLIHKGRLADAQSASEASASTLASSPPLTTNVAPPVLSAAPTLAPSTVVTSSAPVPVIDLQPASTSTATVHAALPTRSALPGGPRFGATAAPRKDNDGASASKPAAKGPDPATPDCDVPYFFDARGNKVFKKGCL